MGRCKLCVTTLYMALEYKWTLVSGEVSGTSLVWVSKTKCTMAAGIRPLPLY